MQSPLKGDGKGEKLDLKAEVIDGIRELLDELEIVDTQIAESALDHIHSNETILTHTSSQTIQKFLSTAARKRKFTVIHAEAYPNDHESTHATILNGSKKKATGDGDDEADERWKPLTDMGITVILIPDTAVFALMSRINKVLLAPHAVLANGSLVAAAGASTIAAAAQAHKVPVVVLSGVYKLSPVFPFDSQELIEYGDPGKVVPYEDGEFMDKVDVVNPVYDFVQAESVDLYITNLGGCAPSFLYRIVADHYRAEDIDLAT
jgi:translation initiation factor eIF-2B subunit beta